MLFADLEVQAQHAPVADAAHVELAAAGEGDVVVGARDGQDAFTGGGTDAEEGDIRAVVRQDVRDDLALVDRRRRPPQRLRHLGGVPWPRRRHPRPPELARPEGHGRWRRAQPRVCLRQKHFPRVPRGSYAGAFPRRVEELLRAGGSGGGVERVVHSDDGGIDALFARRGWVRGSVLRTSGTVRRAAGR
nr:hypothetical protein CFP56_42130 [Quercus suber]